MFGMGADSSELDSLSEIEDSSLEADAIPEKEEGEFAKEC